MIFDVEKLQLKYIIEMGQYIIYSCLECLPIQLVDHGVKFSYKNLFIERLDGNLWLKYILGEL